MKRRRRNPSRSKGAITRRNGGTIAVQSAVEALTEFVVTLPRQMFANDGVRAWPDQRNADPGRSGGDIRHRRLGRCRSTTACAYVVAQGWLTVEDDMLTLTTRDWRQPDLPNAEPLASFWGRGVTRVQAGSDAAVRPPGCPPASRGRLSSLGLPSALMSRVEVRSSTGLALAVSRTSQTLR
jgi:hypothetical protein